MPGVYQVTDGRTFAEAPQIKLRGIGQEGWHCTGRSRENRLIHGLILGYLMITFGVHWVKGVIESTVCLRQIIRGRGSDQLGTYLWQRITNDLFAIFVLRKIIMNFAVVGFI